MYGKNQLLDVFMDYIIALYIYCIVFVNSFDSNLRHLLEPATKKPGKKIYTGLPILGRKFYVDNGVLNTRQDPIAPARAPIRRRVSMLPAMAHASVGR